MNTTAMAQVRPTLDQESAGEPSLKESGKPEQLSKEMTERTSPKTNRVQKLLREAGKNPEQSGLQELSVDIANKASSNRFECKNLSIRALKDEGVAEITLTRDKKEKLTLTVEVEPDKMESFCQELCSSFESGKSRPGKIRIKGSSFFSGAISASLVASIVEESTVVGITGKGSTWKPPQIIRRDENDPYAALRTLENVEIGFEKGSFCFRDVTLVEPSVGKHGREQKDFLKGCDQESAVNELIAESAPSLDTSLTEGEPEGAPAVSRSDSKEKGGEKSESLDSSAPAKSGGESSSSVVTDGVQDKSDSPDSSSAKSRAAVTDRPIEALSAIYKAPIIEPSVQTMILHRSTGAEPEKGSCTDLVLTTNQNNIMLSFTFKGNNLPGADGTAQDADTRIDINFKTDQASEAVTPEILEKITAIVAEQVAESKLTEGVSLTELEMLSKLTQEMQSNKFSASNVFVANTFIDGGEKLFKEATLGSASLLEALYHPEQAAQRPPIANSVIRNTRFKNIAATLENTVLENIDIRSGHLHIVAKEDSALRRISGIGAMMSGQIDCPISGDFRRARLGSKEIELTGKAFEVKEGALQASALERVNHFIVDRVKDGEENPVIKINNRLVSLKELKNGARVEKLSALLENSNYHIRSTINTTSDLQNAFSEQTSLKFDALDKVVTDNNGSVRAELTFEGGDPDTGPLRINADVIVAAEDPIAFNLKDRSGEALIYALERLSVLSADRDSILPSVGSVEKTVASSTETVHQAARDSQVKRGAAAVVPVLDQEVTLIAG